MEVVSFYDAEDENGLRSLKTPNFRIQLDEHCAAISSSDSLKDLRRVYLARALAWLDSLKIPTANYRHDYKTILGIITRVANRRIMDLAKPKLREALDEHCETISSARSLSELKANLGNAYRLVKKVRAGRKIYRPIMKRALNVAGYRQMIRLLVVQSARNSGEKDRAAA